MTHTIIDALRHLPLPKAAPAPWSGTILAEAGSDSYYATCLLPVAQTFMHALTPWLLQEGYLDEREWNLVLNTKPGGYQCPTAQFSTKIFLGPETDLTFGKFLLSKVRRFVRVISRIGSTDDEEFLDLVANCPSLSELRFRASTAKRSTLLRNTGADAEMIEAMCSLAYVMKKHKSFALRSQIARTLSSLMLQCSPATNERKFQLSAKPTLKSFSGATEDEKKATSERVNPLFGIFKTVKHMCLDNAATGLKNNIENLGGFVHYFATVLLIGRYQGFLGEDLINSPLFNGNGGDYQSYAEILDLLETIYDGKDDRFMPLELHGEIIKMLEGIIVLTSAQNRTGGPPTFQFFWKFWKEHRDSLVVPMLNRIPIADTKEKLNAFFLNTKKHLSSNRYDLMDITKAWLGLWNILGTDLYWLSPDDEQSTKTTEIRERSDGSAQETKICSTEISGRSEEERLSVETFIKMMESGRRFLSHLPVAQIVSMWDAASACWREENERLAQQDRLLDATDVTRTEEEKKWDEEYQQVRFSRHPLLGMSKKARDRLMGKLEKREEGRVARVKNDPVEQSIDNEQKYKTQSLNKIQFGITKLAATTLRLYRRKGCHEFAFLWKKSHGGPTLPILFENEDFTRVLVEAAFGVNHGDRITGDAPFEDDLRNLIMSYQPFLNFILGFPEGARFLASPSPRTKVQLIEVGFWIRAGLLKCLLEDREIYKKVHDDVVEQVNDYVISRLAKRALASLKTEEGKGKEVAEATEERQPSSRGSGSSEQDDDDDDDDGPISLSQDLQQQELHLRHCAAYLSNASKVVVELSKEKETAFFMYRTDSDKKDDEFFEHTSIEDKDVERAWGSAEADPRTRAVAAVREISSDIMAKLGEALPFNVKASMLTHRE